MEINVYGILANGEEIELETEHWEGENECASGDEAILPKGYRFKRIRIWFNF